MSLTITHDLLKDLVNQQINDSFLPEYRDKQSQAAGFGLLMSDYFRWDGYQILEASAEALEDANFHKEAAIVRELLAMNKRG